MLAPAAQFGMRNRLVADAFLPLPSPVFPELTVLSVANLLGETIWRVHSSTSVQALRD